MDGACDVKTAGPTNPLGAGMTGQTRGGAKLSGNIGSASENGGHGLHWDLVFGAHPPVGERRSEGEGIVAGVDIALYPPRERLDGVIDASSNGEEVNEPLSKVLLSSSTCAILDLSDDLLPIKFNLLVALVVDSSEEVSGANIMLASTGLRSTIGGNVGKVAERPWCDGIALLLNEEW